MKVVCVYDNHIKPNIFISNIIGDKTFGEVILKRKSIKTKFEEFISNEYIVDECLHIDYDWQIESVLKKIRNYGKDIRIVHIFSHMVLKDNKEIHILLHKAPYIAENYLWVTGEGRPAMFMMHDISEYCSFIDKASSLLFDITTYSQYKQKFEIVTTQAFFDLSAHSRFLQYISGGFDARFFNSLNGDEYTVVKSSRDKRKIKSEYQYYHLLPDYMKIWFVMPFNYIEDSDKASYEMERYHMTDLAIRWVHGAINYKELDMLLKKAFHFINIRQRRIITLDEYIEKEKKLYLNKVRTRIEDLKHHEKYSYLSNYISEGTGYCNLESIIERYEFLYHQITDSMKKPLISVIGHGDLCFSNMLYNKETDLLKLIDPKGALEESELWENPYYDVAKLSHSICGRYDFFNNGLYHIALDSNLKFYLEIDYDNTAYKELFKTYVECNGFLWEAVRIYEVSLFLSMLPLHIDNPQKVFGFILNAIKILEEIEECLRD